MKLPEIHILINSHYLYDMEMVKKMKCLHHIATWARQRYMICFMDEYSSFRTINFAEKFIEVRQIVDEYIVKAERQRDDQVKFLKVKIEDEFMKDIHELVSPSLEVESIPICILINKPNK